MKKKDKEIPGFKRDGELLEQLSGYQLIKEDIAPRSWTMFATRR